ncbi:hypothetical protein Tco_1024911, partial [Tanacetum coccineum]
METYVVLEPVVQHRVPEPMNIIDDTNEQDEEKLDIQHCQSVSDEDMDEEDDLDDFIDDTNVDDDVTRVGGVEGPGEYLGVDEAPGEL